MRAVEKRRQDKWVVGAVALAAIAQLVHDRVAYAQPRSSEAEACFSAAEAAQPLMKERKLRAAQRRLQACAREECPRAARNDCRTWLADVTRALPTVVFVAREESAGGALRAVEDVRVSVDGEVVATQLDASAVPVDPGMHAVRFEHAGFDPVEQRVDVREGESHREIDAVFRAAPPPVKAAPVPVVQPPPPPPPPPEETTSSTLPPEETPAAAPVPAGAYVLGGAGIVALGVGVTMEVLGLSDRQHLSDTCGTMRTCPQSDVDAARGRVLVGDIALGASALLFAGAAYVYFTRGTTPAQAGHAMRMRIGPVGMGMGAGIEGSL
jgi:hypothetical protein